ncbi:anti-anti-sigma factor [Pseudomonas aeruginosa]|nr:anti-anti-sigma factor [Pseudomonas aeruginosa]
MSTGKIQFAEQNGSFVLKFVGEVRLTLCSALDSTIEKIFAALNFSAIIIDLTETQSIDSTTLGLLAKLSILSRQKIGLLPTLVTTNPDITRLLQSMASIRCSTSSTVRFRARNACPTCRHRTSPKRWCATRSWRRTAS